MVNTAIEKHVIAYNSTDIDDKNCHHGFFSAPKIDYWESDQMTIILCDDFKFITDKSANNREHMIERNYRNLFMLVKILKSKKVWQAFLSRLW